jgi:hypothetical protein
MSVNIENFLDDKKRIKAWPSKREMKQNVLLYLSEKFETGVKYTEKEVNEIINNWHTFGDFFLLRRGMIDYRLLKRTEDGRVYWKEESNEDN